MKENYISFIQQIKSSKVHQALRDYTHSAENHTQG